MSSRKLLTFFGLKWNPFTPDVPVEALSSPPAVDSFCQRVEAQLSEGGYALISGDPGTGKSVALRLLAHRLSSLPDVSVGVLTRPQSRLADFYRELGLLFGVPLTPHNRWAGFAALRQKWLAHIESALYHPLLVIDEAQELSPFVLAEIRILASSLFDSKSLLTVVLAGDSRLTALFSQPDFLPLASRIRTRLLLQSVSPQQLRDFLRNALDAAGNPALMSDGLLAALADHAAGNLRLLFNMAAELLAHAFERQIPALDEKLFLELFAVNQTKSRASRPVNLPRA